ncbi:MAG: pyridoxal phosphate-dependent aminotransferase [Pirellulaceae bacterium]
MDTKLTHPWLAKRTARFDSSGIRKMFALGAKFRDPINLSIGQPDFPVPESIKEDLCKSVNENRNAYTSTEGILQLRQKLAGMMDRQFGENPHRRVLVTSGTSGALTLALMAMVNPGDEVIYFDPYFVMYPAIVELAGGVSVPIKNYPHFQPDLDRLKAAITPRTKMIILNSPSNPTGICCGENEMRQVAELAAEKGICLVSDEIYSRFNYDTPHKSPASWNPNTIVIDGFSKSYAMTGLRIGFVHGPAEIIDAMAELQQFTFVNAPSPVQWAAIGALDLDMHAEVDRYRQKRNALIEGLQRHYEIEAPGGAFYAFPKLPRGFSGEAFLQKAIEHEMLVIPGTVFSQSDSHFRISYAVDDRTLERGIDVLVKMAK